MIERLADPTDAERTAANGALATLYNALLTGLVLSLVTRRGQDTAREFVFRLMRHQHLEKFLPGLKKLGLDGMPHAVACALYHYHSNALGGVKTEVLLETDRKAWVRYPPPRWVWRGTAACGIPHEVNAAMLHGWHGHNGVSLGNPRLGFVCTGMITSGAPGLEGYYFEYDRDLREDERVRFVTNEPMPPIDAATQPRLDPAAWPEARLLRTHRAYAAQYVRSLVPVLFEQLSPAQAAAEIGRTARLIGMQFYDETAATLGFAPATGGPIGFARYLAALLAGGGEDVSGERDGGRIFIRQRAWRLMSGVPLGEDTELALRALGELWVGAALTHDRFVPVTLAADATGIIWTIG